MSAIVAYIHQDKPRAALTFAENLYKTIQTLTHSPYKYRQSIYFNDENIRDLIYKGYTIVYKVYLEEEKILLIDIFNKNKR